MTSHLLIKDIGDIKLFAGLETDSDAIIRVYHTHVGAEVEDFNLQCSLTNGNTITTDSKWRHEAISDIQTFIKTVAINLESLTSDQHWVDLESALDILHDISKMVSSDIILLTTVEIKFIFIELKRGTNYLREISGEYGQNVIDVVEYYTASLDTFFDFG